MLLCGVAAGALGVLMLDETGVMPIAPKPASPIVVTQVKTSNIETSAIPEPARVPQPAQLPIELRAGDETETRMAYVPAGALPLRMQIFAEEFGPDAAEPLTDGNWLAEVKTEPAPVPMAGPRIANLAPASLPWLKPAGARATPYSLKERLTEISPLATQRLTEKFRAAMAPFPPTNIALVAIKDERVIELHTRSDNGPWTFIHRYPVLAASGISGPKLKQGDKQVPEGIYGISFLNPNSRYHVALRVSYPNAFDKRMAAKDGRKDLGGDIMIHGKNASIGCLAIGDQAAEELFVLAARTGLQNIKLIIAPTDFRRNGIPAATGEQPNWLPGLYTEVASAMSEYKSPPPAGGLISLFWQ